MIIKEFNLFKKKYQKINEGGGAGKEFIFDSINGSLDLKITKDKVEVLKKEISAEEPLRIEGYMESIGKLDPNKLFEFDIEYTFNLDKFKKVTFGEIEYEIGDKYDIDEDKTVGEYLEEGNEMIIDTEIVSNYKYMHGAGYMSVSFEEGKEIEFDIFDGYSDGTGIYLDKNMLHNLPDKFMDVTIKLTANKSMGEIFDEVFVTTQSYEEYLDTMKDEDEEDIMDEDLYYEIRFDHIIDEYGWED